MLIAYLAGGYDDQNHGWRTRLGKELRPKIEGINPFLHNQKSIDQFVSEDLESIRGSDILIAYNSGDYISYGMAAEIGYARAFGIPVILVDETTHPNSFLVGCSKRLFTSMDALIEWWNNGQGEKLNNAET